MVRLLTGKRIGWAMTSMKARMFLQLSHSGKQVHEEADGINLAPDDAQSLTSSFKAPRANKVAMSVATKTPQHRLHSTDSTALHSQRPQGNSATLFGVVISGILQQEAADVIKLSSCTWRIWSGHPQGANFKSGPQEADSSNLL